MKKQTEQRNLYLDLVKLVLAFFVVGIHFEAIELGTGKFLPLFRMAVPMFFMISGYFLYSDNNEKQLANAKRFLLNTLKYLGIAFIIYFIYSSIMVLITSNDITAYFINLFGNYFAEDYLLLDTPMTSSYHLWFLITLAAVACMHYSFIKFNRTRLYYFIVPVCLFVFFFLGGYIQFFPIGAEIANLDISRNVLYLHLYRNSIFMGLPMVALGYIIHKAKFLNSKPWLKWLYLGLGILFFGLQYLESRLLTMECYISSALCAAFLLMFFTNLKCKFGKFYYKYIGKEAPLYIYILHLGVGKCLTYYFNIPQSLRVITIYVATFAIYEIAYLICMLAKYLFKLYKNRKHILQFA